MKTEFSTNGELPIPKEKEDRRGVVIQDHYEKSSEHRHEDGSSGKEKKRTLFRRPGMDEHGTGGGSLPNQQLHLTAAALRISRVQRLTSRRGR